MAEPNYESPDYVQGYLDGHKAKALYAHARLHKVLNYIESEMKELFEEEKTNRQEEGK